MKENVEPQKGTSRNGRMPEELDPAYVKVDERSLIDMLTFAGGYSRLINYYNRENRLSGNWYDFFLKDQAILLSFMAKADLEGGITYVNALIGQIYNTQDETKKFGMLKMLFAAMVEIPKQLNFFYSHLTAGEEQNPIIAELTAAVKGKLSKELSRLKYYDMEAGNALGMEIGMNYEVFKGFWNIDVDDRDFNSPYTGGTRAERIDSAVIHVRAIFHTFIDTLTYIVTEVKANFEKSILDRNDHKPHIALYMGFLKLFGHAQEMLNTFTGRHLDFYYNDVLRQYLEEGEPDKVFVNFELSPQVDVQLLPAGTRLITGKTASGKEMMYTTDKDIYVNKTVVAEARTIYVSRNPLIYTGSKKKLVTNIFSNDNVQKNNDPHGRWPTFGEEQFSLGEEYRTLADAAIGFALASPALVLSEGARTVSLSITFDAKGFAAMHKILAEIGESESRTAENIAMRIFSSGFAVRLSVAGGWLVIDRYSGSADMEKRTIVFRFTLASSDPAVLGYTTEEHGDKYNTSWPVLEMLLCNDAPTFAYSLLNGMKIEDIIIHTAVEGVRDLDLFNNLGGLNADKPFQPFGPVPGYGATLLIGKSELFMKELEEMRLNIEWQDLPPCGFSEYYSSYDMDIRNTSYGMKLSALKEGRWIPEANARQEFRMFTETDPGALEHESPLSEFTVLDDIDMSRIRMIPDYSLPRKMEYDPSTQYGFIRLELSDPPFAFGHADYGRIMSETITYNSRHKKDQRAVPNLPYTPVIKSISLDYKASLRLRSQDKKREQAVFLFHVHPFGMQEAGPVSNIIDNTLIPQYNDEGNLYLGLANLQAPQPVNIFFQLAESAGNALKAQGEVQWSYLSNNKWIPLRRDNVLSDSTANFIQPGIVSLDIPPDITTGNTIMPSALHWIKAAFPECRGLASRTVALATQAVPATWMFDQAALMHLDHPLPPDSIKKLLENVPGIKKVNQPFASFGGRPRETKKEYYNRVSERLRHRKRAITAWDVEHLVLQHFPSVYRATCFPGKTSTAKDPKTTETPGSMLLVVIPDVRQKMFSNIYRPRDSYGTLQEIRHFLKGRMSPFVKLEVINPLYEWVKVACKVKFKKGLDGGFYLRQMNEDIKRYLSPWLFDEGADIKMGGGIYRSDLLGFLERRPYIDYLTSFSVIVTADRDNEYSMQDTAAQEDDSDKLEPRTPWSIQVSADHHSIALIADEKYMKPEKRGIENIIISEDLIITR
jgi:hypothetical protein